MVERVDERVRLLADVAGARLEQGSRRRRGRRRRDRDAAGLVVDAVGRSRGRRRDDGAVGPGDGVPDLTAPHALDGLEHLGRGLTHGDEVGMRLVESGHALEHPQGGREVVGIDAGRLQRGGGGGLVGHM